jgi:hypothetical protein
MIDAAAIGVIVTAAVLLAALTWMRRRSAGRLRSIPALTKLYRAVGLGVEDGTRLLVGLGNTSLLTRNAASALAGLGLLREVTQKTSVSDKPPVAVAGEAVLALLAQDTLQTGYRLAGAAEFFQPGTGRLAGLTPFSSAAATMPMLADEHVSASALVGHFGVEAALLAETAQRRDVLLIGASDEPAATAALFASSSDVLIGEEVYAPAAYLGRNPSHTASLTMQDILRWLTIAGLLAGVGLKIVGLI